MLTNCNFLQPSEKINTTDMVENTGIFTLKIKCNDNYDIVSSDCVLSFDRL